MTIAERLQSLIPDRGFNVAEVARLAGMHKQALHAIVQGTNDSPKLDTLRRIAGALGVTLAELFEGVGEGEEGSDDGDNPKNSQEK
jgi:transcriptional regulator with XRE-family HTH domain